MKIISTNDALKPTGHYSQAIEHNGFVFISGILPICAETGEKKQGTIQEETATVLDNLKRILEAAESDISKVIKTVIYIPDISLWDSVNQIYTEVFKDHKPARAIVPTNRLHFDFKIELEAIAITE